MTTPISDVKACCRCGGHGGDYADDGYLPCYHCYDEGACGCKPPACDTCEDSGFIRVIVGQLEWIDEPGQDPYIWRRETCPDCGMVTRAEEVKGVRKENW